MAQNTAALSANALRIKTLLSEGTPDMLETEVKDSKRKLGQLKSLILSFNVQSEEANQWLQRIDCISQMSITEPTIIGVMGSTGAGKSSLINAILDEERLLPTSCMRACTAVVTEISWNSNNNENARYRAEVEFIKVEEWKKELRILFKELLDDSGNVSRKATNKNSEASIAYAKITAVYPSLTRDVIAQSSIEDLISQPSVQNILGTTSIVEEAYPDRLYCILQTFVDSKDNSSKDNKKDKKEMEYWPLIKVVKIYTKSDALSTGAVIVDLPGVQDSNAARSAIAQNYMKICTGLWIVAPIMRAVDDKTAKSLLGESFKRQLMYDGIYSRVTFICSKTDDILITEAFDSLGLAEELSFRWENLNQIEQDQKTLKQKLVELKRSRTINGKVMNETDGQLKLWKRFRCDAEGGKSVYPPAEGLNKRQRLNGLEKQRKKRLTNESSNDDDLTDSATEEEYNLEAQVSVQHDSLTLETIENKIAKLKSTKKEAFLQGRELDANVLALEEELKHLDMAYDEILAETYTICISRRNQYSKGVIQQDFAAGIKELDQENQIESNEADFNPNEDLRDYTQIAESLPVFCVSSRAYQKLCGRLRWEKNVPGFGTIEETEIPQLRIHCQKLTEAGRSSTYRRFLNSFNQLISSLSLWTCNESSVILSDAVMAVEGQFLQSKLRELESDLEKAVQTCLNEMGKSLSENLYNRFDQAIAIAIDKANITASKWGAPVNRLNQAAGGLHWAIYKAVCYRRGVYSNENGSIDFNLELAEPIIKKLCSKWEEAFTHTLPQLLQSFTEDTKELLHSFHNEIRSSAIKSDVSLAGLAVLGQQLQNYEHMFLDLTQQMVTLIGKHQKDANREFTPVIERHLLSAYEYCTAEQGVGCYMRMKAHMASHVDSKRQTMFHESTDEVKKHLTHMRHQVEEQMSNKADEVFVLIRRDYMKAITGAHMPQGIPIPKRERLMKEEIAKVFGNMEEATRSDLEVKTKTEL